MGGIVDMFTGQTNRKAMRMAEKDSAAQRQIAERMARVFDVIFGKVQQADQQGQFDPWAQIRMADEASRFNEDRQRKTDASTAAILGYHPGDTAPVVKDRQTSEAYDLQRRMQNFQIAQQTFQNKLNAYNSAPGQLLGGAGQMYGQNAQQWLSMLQDPSQFFQAASMFFTPSALGGVAKGGGNIFNPQAFARGVARGTWGW